MQKRGVRALVTLPAVVALAAVAVAAPPVAAGGGTTIDVTTTQDIDGSESTCSLREAVEAANTDTAFGGCPAGNGADTIRLPAGRYVFAPVPGTDEDANVDGDIDILEGVTIRGVGSTRTTIDGNGEETGERVFNMPTGVRATFRDLTIRNGRDQTGDGGGAIFSDDGTGNLVLRTVRILANYGEGYGGGVAMDGTGDLRIYNSVIEDNDSDGYGGGVYTLRERRLDRGLPCQRQ
jgi:CSLREA domain-containing protein